MATRLEAQNQPVTVDTVYDRVFEDIMREANDRLPRNFDASEFRSELASLSSAFVANRQT